MREQADKEDRARVIALLAALDAGPGGASHQLMWRQGAPRATRPEDPLEQLWSLPARQPR